MAKQIPLSQRKVALVDDEDYEWLRQRKWHCRNGYATHSEWDGSSGKARVVRMHREIMQPPEGMEVDHINHDKLDNRRENLRICTHAENQHNSRMQRNNTSGFRGVCHFRNRWTARIKMGGIQRNLGYYGTPEAAARAYDEAAKELHGEFAALNFARQTS